MPIWKHLNLMHGNRVHCALCSNFKARRYGVNGKANMRARCTKGHLKENGGLDGPDKLISLYEMVFRPRRFPELRTAEFCGDWSSADD